MDTTAPPKRRPSLDRQSGAHVAPASDGCVGDLLLGEGRQEALVVALRGDDATPAAPMLLHEHQETPLPRDWSTASRVVARNDYPALLWRGFVAGKVPSDLLPGQLAKAWRMSHYSEYLLGARTWLEMWADAIDLGTEYLSNLDTSVRAALPDSLTVYRRATPDRARGMSWLSDVSTTRWQHASAGASAARLYVAEVPRSAVLGRMSLLDECEWVLDPAQVEPRPLG